MAEDIGEELELPCDFATALELWIAYKEHGVMARSGGLLDQPRWWRTVIRLISSRHSPIYDQHRAQQKADSDKPKQGSGGEAWEREGLPVADGWDALNSSG